MTEKRKWSNIIVRKQKGAGGMLYIVDFIILVGSILILSAGIVWAFRSSDYNKNPLHRLYRLLSSGYLKMSEFVMSGWDALKEKKDELCEKIFGSSRVSFAAGSSRSDRAWKNAGKAWSSSPAGVRNREFKRKILK